MTEVLTEDRMYEFVRTHDSRLDGVFFFGALDSDVYCVPSCTVRTPLRRNIRFFLSKSEAESAGRRPCMRCRPDLVTARSLADVWYGSGHD